MKGTRPPRPTHPQFTSELWTLVQQCWSVDPYSRPEASEILKEVTSKVNNYVTSNASRRYFTFHDIGLVLNMLWVSENKAPARAKGPKESSVFFLRLSCYRGEHLPSFYITDIDHPVSSTPQLPLHLDSDTAACKRLIAHELSQTEVIPLIEKMFNSQNEVKMIGGFHGDDARTFIDVMDKV